LRVWNWLSIGLLVLLFAVGVMTASRVTEAAILVAGGLVQVVFGTMPAANRREFAERLARYYAQRPVMLGGFVANRYRLSWRLQGAAMAIFGVALFVLAGFLIGPLTCRNDLLVAVSGSRV
jgi:hypothetical protein